MLRDSMSFYFHGKNVIITLFVTNFFVIFSVPGPGPDMSLDEMDEVSDLVKRNFSFANVQKPEVGFHGKNAPSTTGKGNKLKRSETERLFTRTNR